MNIDELIDKLQQIRALAPVVDSAWQRHPIKVMVTDTFDQEFYRAILTVEIAPGFSNCVRLVIGGQCPKCEEAETT